MLNELPGPQRPDEWERNAYNAAFYELGFSWHWDGDTHQQLMREAETAAARLRLYLETRQAHLLRAYDAAFLIDAIEAAKAEHLRRGSAAPVASPTHVNWGQLSGCQVGA